MELTSAPIVLLTLLPGFVWLGLFRFVTGYRPSPRFGDFVTSIGLSLAALVAAYGVAYGLNKTAWSISAPMLAASSFVSCWSKKPYQAEVVPSNRLSSSCLFFFQPALINESAVNVSLALTIHAAWAWIKAIGKGLALLAPCPSSIPAHG